MGNVPISAAWLAALMTVGPVAAADSFRCGNWVISEVVSVAELKRKCGEPARREVETIEVRGPSEAGGGVVKKGETTIERWTYDRGSRAFAMVVTIVDGEIRSIERAE